MVNKLCSFYNYSLRPGCKAPYSTSFLFHTKENKRETKKKSVFSNYISNSDPQYKI